jgi:hypothetical protein
MILFHHRAVGAHLLKLAAGAGIAPAFASRSAGALPYMSTIAYTPPVGLFHQLSALKNPRATRFIRQRFFWVLASFSLSHRALAAMLLRSSLTKTPKSPAAA